MGPGEVLTHFGGVFASRFPASPSPYRLIPLIWSGFITLGVVLENGLSYRNVYIIVVSGVFYINFLRGYRQEHNNVNDIKVCEKNPGNLVNHSEGPARSFRAMPGRSVDPMH